MIPCPWPHIRVHLGRSPDRRKRTILFLLLVNPCIRGASSCTQAQARPRLPESPPKAHQKEPQGVLLLCISIHPCRREDRRKRTIFLPVNRSIRNASSFYKARDRATLPESPGEAARGRHRPGPSHATRKPAQPARWPASIAPFKTAPALKGGRHPAVSPFLGRLTRKPARAPLRRPSYRPWGPAWAPHPAWRLLVRAQGFRKTV